VVHCAHGDCARGEQAICGAKVRRALPGLGRFIEQLAASEEAFTCKACRVALKKWQREEPLRLLRAKQEIKRQLVTPPRRQLRLLRSLLDACGRLLQTRALRIAVQVDAAGVRRLEKARQEVYRQDRLKPRNARPLYTLLDACEGFRRSKAMRIAVEVDRRAVQRLENAYEAARKGDPRGWGVPWSVRALDTPLDMRERWGP
jgi:hypothetical protein